MRIEGRTEAKQIKDNVHSVPVMLHSPVDVLRFVVGLEIQPLNASITVGQTDVEFRLKWAFAAVFFHANEILHIWILADMLDNPVIILIQCSVRKYKVLNSKLAFNKPCQSKLAIHSASKYPFICLDCNIKKGGKCYDS